MEAWLVYEPLRTALQGDHKTKPNQIKMISLHIKQHVECRNEADNWVWTFERCETEETAESPESESFS